MKMTSSDVRWILDRKVTGSVLEPRDGADRVEVTDGTRTMVLSYDGQMLRFNDRFVAVDDDLSGYLAVMDEIEQKGWSQPEAEEPDAISRLHQAMHTAPQGDCDICDEVSAWINRQVGAG